VKTRSRGRHRPAWAFRWIAALCFAITFGGCADTPKLEVPLTEPQQIGWAAVVRTNTSVARPIRDFVLRHAPYKQIDPKTGKPNERIGRTPGSACEVIRYLAALAASDPADREAVRKAEELARWVIRLQETDRSSAAFGGVPSTPDLPMPANRYFYTIDAGFCGTAMFSLYDLTKNEQYREAGLRFADFLLNMHSGRNRPYSRSAGLPDGFCEFVVVVGPQPAWNCDRHAKNLIALPVLRRAAQLTGKKDYEMAAQSARTFLVEGLSGAWEHADTEAVVACETPTCPHAWRRVPGPKEEPDYFVYGDTLAYALRGLFEFEGASSAVRTLYAQFAAYRGKDEKTRRYDGRIAFAGYLHPKSQSPDPLSAYYDVVTLGILHNLRRAVNADHYAAADSVLRNRLASTAQLPWRMGFDFNFPTDVAIDLTTLANIGEALTLPPAPARN